MKASARLALTEETAFYRLFYESWRNDFTELIVGARTPAELDRRIRMLEAGGASASCQTPNDRMCVDVSVTSLVSVIVNDHEVLVARGTTVFHAILTAGESNPSDVVSRVRVWKRWNGRLVRIALDQQDKTILQLALSGGERISWRGSSAPGSVAD